MTGEIKRERRNAKSPKVVMPKVGSANSMAGNALQSGFSIMRGANFSFCIRPDSRDTRLGTGLIVGVDFSFKEFLSLD